MSARFSLTPNSQSMRGTICIGTPIFFNQGSFRSRWARNISTESKLDICGLSHLRSIIAISSLRSQASSTRPWPAMSIETFLYVASITKPLLFPHGTYLKTLGKARMLQDSKIICRGHRQHMTWSRLRGGKWGMIQHFGMMPGMYMRRVIVKQLTD